MPPSGTPVLSYAHGGECTARSLHGGKFQPYDWTKHEIAWKWDEGNPRALCDGEMGGPTYGPDGVFLVAVGSSLLGNDKFVKVERQRAELEAQIATWR